MTRSAAFRIAMTVLALAAFGAASAADTGFQGWGPRVGATDDPDQIVVGVHLDMGEIARNVRWQPNFEIGFGDDWKSLSGNVLVAYYFGKQGRFQPYAGGQLAIVYFDHDDNGFDDDRSDGDTEFGFDAVGGFEFPLGAGARMLFELQLGFGDVHDAKIVAGWKF